MICFLLLRYIYQLRIRNMQTDRIAYTHRQLLDECMYVYITNSCWLYISVREYVFSQHIAITWIAFTWNNKQLRIYIANSYADSQWAAICVVHTHTSIYMYYNHFIFLFFLFASIRFIFDLFVCLSKSLSFEFFMCTNVFQCQQASILEIRRRFYRLIEIVRKRDKFISWYID